MKKISVVTLASLILFGFNSLKAQESTKKEESENCVSKGKFIIDAYYGYPYLVGSYVNQLVTESGSSSSIDVTNLNHLGGRFEYMLNNTIGLGFEYTYASVTAKYAETYSMYNNSTNQYEDHTDMYKVGINKQRMLAKINIHFATSKYLDPYATAGIGYKKTNVYSNNINDQDLVNEVYGALNIVPVAFRMGIGMRYYFIKNMGIGIEAGIGGPAVQIGLSGKF
jgi:opacity protein-like surface antigen